EAFRWTAAGGMAGLGDLAGGSFASQASSVSGDGSFVVGYGNSASGQEAFIWDQSSGMLRLQTVLTSNYGLDLTGWTLSNATGISSDGRTVVGYGIHNGNQEAWMAQLPEPSTASLLALGLGVVWRRRRAAR
ncbi:MAG: PEP-CTERM sorting domain-containing protein, partial [Verrucomicrobia bacterium]|nr:PEP-CTERM sorting domain-containing protein [Verrucomicrobiota bacterium]